MDPSTDPSGAATAAAAFLAAETGAPRHDVAIVLGSGWSSALKAFDPPPEAIPMSRVPGFTARERKGMAGRSTRSPSATYASSSWPDGSTPTRATTSHASSTLYALPQPPAAVASS